MSDTSSTTTDVDARPRERTNWERLPDADPIRIYDPLAEVLGTVAEGDPLVVTFEEVVTAVGHACPAVAGAYRSTQLALERLYPEERPVRSEIEVTVGGSPETHGVGPMANVIRHVTGAADETGFAGFGGYGGRDELLTFGDVDGPGRSFRFERTDTGDAVTVSFEPAATGVEPDEGGGPPMKQLSRVVAGEATEAEATAFREQWYERVQRVLDAPADGGPFTVREHER